MRASADTMRSRLLAHRDGAEIVSSSIALGLTRLPLTAMIHEPLHRAGASAETIDIAARTLGHFLLGHAFEDCGFERVKLQTDSINQRSRDAIARLGAVQEGVLRHHQPRADGSWRDTVVFSILSAEWPTVQAGLESRVRATLASLTAQGS